MRTFQKEKEVHAETLFTKYLAYAWKRQKSNGLEHSEQSRVMSGGAGDNGEELIVEALVEHSDTYFYSLS